ncbi:MAG: enoyl-CoA hydratase/isomerase family protein [Rhizobiales bacterium]|nr:enoyl-CoA hydratase/isomerase family protein [Hyphomicrobiales bacterium]
MAAGDQIKKVCVIGAGTMGSGIAGQVANAGHQVLLLDITAQGENRLAILERAIDRLKKSDPPALIHKGVLSLIETGTIEDDLEKVADCDLVVEAVVERLDIKRALYARLEPLLKPGAIVASNTSTIPIRLLVEGMSDDFARRFCIMHFFNPVRYMRLLELVRGEKTAPGVMAAAADYSDRVLGKGVVQCADTPGFLGNRVGVFALQVAIDEAMKLGLTVEEADALAGRPMGIPKTGSFGLYDLIGLDLMADVVRSLRSILPDGDAFHAVGAENPIINRLCEKGFTGNKGLGGFYREGDNGERLALDLESELYRPRHESLFEHAAAGERRGLNFLIQGTDKEAIFCWNFLNRVLRYAASLIPDVTQSPQDIDDAMKLGYNWVKGPFEMLDEIGSAAFVARCTLDGLELPAYLEALNGAPVYKVEAGDLCVRHADGAYRPVALPQGVVRFHMARRTLTPMRENASASLFNLAGDIRLVEFHTKANALDGDCMAIVRAAAGDPGRGIIIHNDGQHFSAGVNLERFQSMMADGDWAGIDAFLNDFQQACRLLKYCPAPVVGAPSGLAIGGGFEVIAHAGKVIAHTNSVMGLVECTVGVVPGGGGVKETLWRWYQKTGDWEKAAWNTFNQIGYSQTGSSPYLSAKLAYFLPERDREVMNRDRLIEGARAMIDAMAPDYQPPAEPVFHLVGGTVYAAMRAFLEKGRDEGTFFPHDVTVASAIARIVTGGEGAEPGAASEQDLYDLERSSFLILAKTPETKARIDAMLSGRGGLRN